MTFMLERHKQILKFIAKLIITAVLLTWVLFQVDLRQLGQAIREARWSLLWIVWGLTIVAYWILAVKLRLILKKLDCQAGTGVLFGASAVTALYGMVLPGVFDTPIKWYILKRHTGKGSNVFSGMVYNQFTSLLIIIVSALVALIVTNPGGNWQLPVICSALLVVSVAGTLSLLSRRVGQRLAKYLTFMLKPLPASVRDTGNKILQQLSVFRTAAWSFHFTAFVLSVASSTIVGTIIYIFVAKAARISVPVGVLIWQCSVIFLLGRLPISIANLGVREATLVGTLALYGVDASAALLMSMIIFSNKILMAIIGAVFQLYWMVRMPAKNAGA
jgi:uncharacterized membrane protein YbhN (UPF0104 family)